MKRLFHFSALSWLLLLTPQAALACTAPPPFLQAEPAQILRGLENDSAPYLAAIDEYAAAMEACYDGPLGPLELAPLVNLATQLGDVLAATSGLAEARVRGNELDYETLLSSPLWGDLEAMRVAGAYASAWGHLAAAVRQVSAEDKKQALQIAQQKLTRLGFEFKHPVLVQRSMYGLATAQIEAGQLAAAKETLQRLSRSLQRGSAADFKTAVAGFLARISAPDYQPPTALFAAPEKSNAPRRVAGDVTGDLTGNQRHAADNAISLARQALREARPATEIAALLEPAMRASPDMARAALGLAARDQTILQAMDYPPGPSLRVMHLAFEARQYGQIISAWPDLKPFYRLMPAPLKRQIDYQIGVARLNLNQLALAIDHLSAAKSGLSDGPQKTRIEKLIVLARLSVDKPPNDARIELAQQYVRPMAGPVKADTPSTGAVDPEAALARLLDLRARIVLARHATAQKDWVAADKWLTGIGPEEPAYQLFLGMRVRLLAQAIKGRKAAGAEPKQLLLTARGAHILYRLWRTSDCPPGCPTGDRLAVHRAAIELALSGGLDSTAFGYGWGGFVEEGGDVAPLLPRALTFLVTETDGDRLLALLEPADEVLAAQVLAQWKRYLSDAKEKQFLAQRYGWLANGLPDLQGRPKAVLLEILTAYDLQRNRPALALAHAEALAAGFPRRPAAWFMRAAALQANQRHLEAARALAALAQRTPANDPVGMGARLGMAALFVALERDAQACAMRAKIFSRPQAAENWQQAVTAFPILKGWRQATEICNG